MHDLKVTSHRLGMDRQRGISVDLPYRSHLDPAIKHLAHWICSDERLQSGITETQLVAKTVEYLCPNRLDDVEEAREVAQPFVFFYEGRAWVFTDTGSTAAGIPLYQFTHRTFLEYFAAGYLVRVTASAADLYRQLLPRILHQEWGRVAELSLSMKEEQEEGAAAVFLMRTTFDRLADLTSYGRASDAAAVATIELVAAQQIRMQP